MNALISLISNYEIKEWQQNRPTEPYRLALIRDLTQLVQNVCMFSLIYQK